MLQLDLRIWYLLQIIVIVIIINNNKNRLDLYSAFLCISALHGLYYSFTLHSHTFGITRNDKYVHHQVLWGLSRIHDLC